MKFEIKLISCWNKQYDYDDNYVKIEINSDGDLP